MRAYSPPHWFENTSAGTRHPETRRERNPATLSGGTMGFELLEHPADIGFRAPGATLEALFANCALALVSIILEPAEIRSAQEVRIAAGEDIESLLVNWLNEVLHHVDGRCVALSTFAVPWDQNRAHGCAWGEARDPKRHPPRLIVKAVTYQQLKLVQTAGGWAAEVYLDV